VDDGQPAAGPSAYEGIHTALKAVEVISPPSWATAGRTRLSRVPLILATIAPSSPVCSCVADFACHGPFPSRSGGWECSMIRRQQGGFRMVPLDPSALVMGHEISAKEHAGHTSTANADGGLRAMRLLLRGGNRQCPFPHGGADRAGISTLRGWAWIRSE